MCWYEERGIQIILQLESHLKVSLCSGCLLYLRQGVSAGDRSCSLCAWQGPPWLQAVPVSSSSALAGVCHWGTRAFGDPVPARGVSVGCVFAGGLCVAPWKGEEGEKQQRWSKDEEQVPRGCFAPGIFKSKRKVCLFSLKRVRCLNYQWLGAMQLFLCGSAWSRGWRGWAAWSHQVPGLQKPELFLFVFVRVRLSTWFW